MPLPKISLPIFELKLVSREEPVKFRPFLVKEEKLLLMALQDDDNENILKTIKQVINNCLVDDIDIDSIPIFDVEYLFLNVRARSVGEKVETAFLCQQVIGTTVDEDNEEVPVQCKNLMTVEVNLLHVMPPAASVQKRIQLTSTVGVHMKYPTIANFRNVEGLLFSEDNEQVYELIMDCCEYVYDETSIYYTNETTKEEFYQFLESLTQEQFDKITDFFGSLPKLELDIEHKCEKCGFDHKLHLEGLNDFFT
jgi:hypothetical protein